MIADVTPGWLTTKAGKEIRLLRQAIGNLAGALVSIGGFNAHTGERKNKPVSLVYLVESEDLDVAIPTRADAAKTGALRGRSIEIKLAGWLLLAVRIIGRERRQARRAILDSLAAVAGGEDTIEGDAERVA